MTKTQNLVWNYLSIFVALLSYTILKIYTDSNYLQTVQKIFISLIFICGFIIVINNVLYFKQSIKKYITILLLCFGIALFVYSGFVLYLIFALQNTGF